jgi:hypothetical protein
MQFPHSWVVDSTKPADAHEDSNNNNNKKKWEGKQSNETAALAQANKTTEPKETAAFVSGVVTASDSKSIAHLLLTSDYPHLTCDSLEPLDN